MTFCPDCLADGKAIGLIYDLAQQGHVCDSCGRVYSALNGTPNNLHYVSKEKAMTRMEKDRAKRKDMSVSTHAMVDRILKSNS